MKGPLEEMLVYYRELHASILEEFSTITDPELDLPSSFWEETRFPIRYRLHPFEAHILQHTIQIDKTLVNIGAAPSESRRLTRYLFVALAEVNSTMIGSKNAENPLAVITTEKIEERREEITSSLIQQQPLKKD